MPPTIRNLLVTEAALDKLGARNISDDEAEQLPRNPTSPSRTFVDSVIDPSRRSDESSLGRRTADGR